MQKVLLISPQPFFQWRGSPIRVGFNVQALANSGYQVDLLTLPIGEKREMEGVEVIRVANPFRLKNIAIGPSLHKIVFDLLLFCKGLRLIFTNKYIIVHGIEETGIIAVVLAKLNGAKAIFEKHSDPYSYKKGFLKNCILACYAFVERITTHLSDGVICTGEGLVSQVKEMGHTTPVFHIFDIPSSLVEANEKEAAKIRKKLQKEEEEVLVCFVGSFAVYQGVELMFAAIPNVVKACPNAKFVIIGGNSEEISERENEFQAAGIPHAIHFLGKIAPDSLPNYLAAADILLSPRSSGVNTPLKLLDYFKAGRAIVATDISSNRLILNESNSVLTASDPNSFAEGIISLIESEDKRNKLGANGHSLYMKTFNFTEYIKQLQSCYNHVLNNRGVEC
ncbi:MAG: glycosyltransferase family 4 protein [Bacteroidetes bacterium]|nr:glycosyltransferase family 4 protein [Bacteroidota bacterium]